MSETEILFTYKMINTCQCEMAADIFCIDFSTGLNSPIADAHCVHLNRSCYLKFRLCLHAKKKKKNLTSGFQTGIHRLQWSNVRCNNFKPEIITEENCFNCSLIIILAYIFSRFSWPLFVLHLTCSLSINTAL